MPLQPRPRYFTNGKEQYVEPILFGMKVNIPYDVANLFNRFPFQGALSVLLSLGLAFILFFGVITAPFGYMFGVPSEKYILGDYKLKHPEETKGRELGNIMQQLGDQIEVYYPGIEESSSSSVLLNYIRMEKQNGRMLFSDKQDYEEETCCQTMLYYFDSIVEYLEYWEPGFRKKWQDSLQVLRRRLGGKVGKEVVSTLETSLSTGYTPDFQHSMFHLISEKVSPECQKRILCHAHGAMQFVPVSVLKIYHKFSKKLIQIPPGYVEAMRIGLKNETDCSEVFAECQDNKFTLALKTYLGLLPDPQQINKMPRRKHKMYSKMNFLKKKPT